MVPCDVVELRDVARGRRAEAVAQVQEEGRAIARALPAGCRMVALDSRGKELSSEELARWLGREQQLGRDLWFVIGGADGLDPEMGRRAHLVLSLGRMTWTHEMARALLAEQLYRAFTILRGIPYHK
jgi:23S rRNA (pseudouridine1915-N3)-methyltransferase